MTWPFFKTGQRDVGKAYYLFYSLSKERVRYFSSQAGGWKKEGVKNKKKPMIGPTRLKTKKKFPGKAEAKSLKSASWYLHFLSLLISCFMFPRRKVSSEQVFQRTAVVDCSCFLIIPFGKFCPGTKKKKQKQKESRIRTALMNHIQFSRQNRWKVIIVLEYCLTNKVILI